MNEYETIHGEAARLGVSVATVKRRLREYKATNPPATALIHDGRTVRIRHEDFCRFLAERRRA